MAVAIEILVQAIHLKYLAAHRIEIELLMIGGAMPISLSHLS